MTTKFTVLLKYKKKFYQNLEKKSKRDSGEKFLLSQISPPKKRGENLGLRPESSRE